jgi:hypothetical protein
MSNRFYELYIGRNACDSSAKVRKENRTIWSVRFGIASCLGISTIAPVNFKESNESMKTQGNSFAVALVATLSITAIQLVMATENVPHAPFAEWADVPLKGQLVTRLTYQESEAYYFWAGNTRYKVDYSKNGEHYGIDINQGYISLQYGLTEQWAIDLAVGYTTSGWRQFDNPPGTSGESHSTTGLMDFNIGVRYQIWKEGENDCPYLPTLSIRAGAVLPGSFDENFPFAPGTRSTAVEPELIARKHFGWEGFGAYGDALFRWNHTSANDCYIFSIGFFQQIKGWELDAGYRRLGSINGGSIQYDPISNVITYPRAVRENQDAIEAGFSYRFKKWNARAGFYTRTVLDGANTDKKFWLGGFLEIPFDLFTSK